MTRFLIDLPGQFEPKKHWQDFLAKMRKLPRNDPGVRLAIKHARRALARPDAPSNSGSSKKSR